jgi:hypothetical protein
VFCFSPPFFFPVVSAPEPDAEAVTDLPAPFEDYLFDFDGEGGESGIAVSVQDEFRHFCNPGPSGTRNGNEKDNGGETTPFLEPK